MPVNPPITKTGFNPWLFNIFAKFKDKKCPT